LAGLMCGSALWLLLALGVPLGVGGGLVWPPVAIFIGCLGLVICATLSLASWIWFLGISFQERLACGLGHFVPLFNVVWTPYYLITRWDDTRRPFLVNLGSLAMSALYAGMLVLGSRPERIDQPGLLSIRAAVLFRAADRGMRTRAVGCVLCTHAETVACDQRLVRVRAKHAPHACQAGLHRTPGSASFQKGCGGHVLEVRCRSMKKRRYVGVPEWHPPSHLLLWGFTGGCRIVAIRV